MKTKRILSFILSLVMCLAIVGTIPAMAAGYSRTQYYNDSIINYEDVDLSDDQFFTDEKFFGVWDDETGDWKEGYNGEFYYEKYPELAAVEAAAKLGDYETCKEELLAFYREKSSNYNMGYTPGILTDAARASGELDFTNSSGTTLGTAAFTETESWQGINVKDQVAYNLNRGITTQLFAICAANKDGYRLEIDHGGEYMPYMKIEVNGESKIYKATKATYTDGLITDYRDLVPNKMLVEESVTSIGSDYHMDENTKRGFIQFEFPNISENDDVTGVLLYLHGKMVEDDIPEEPLYERTYKKLHVFQYTLLTDLPVNFNCTQMYANGEFFYNNDMETGYRRRTTRYTDDISTAWDTGFAGGGNAAEAYRLSGDETFAYHAIRELIYNIKYFGDYDKLITMNHHALDMASWGYNKVWFIDKLMPSKHMTPEAFTYILKGIRVRLEWFEKNWLSMYEGHNWGGYAVQGILAPSMFYHEFRGAHGELWRNPDGSYYLENEYQGSVRGGWLEVANYRNSFKVGGSMNEDGSSVEAPIGYTFESLSAYLKPKEFGEKLNFDYSVFYTPKVEDDSDYIYASRERMRKALMYLASITTPNGGQFQVGDSDAWDSSMLGQFKKGYLDYLDDPELEYIVYQGERGTEPSFKTVAYEGNHAEGEEDVWGGKVVCFRNDWDETAVAAMFQAWGRAGHSHQDDLSISLMAYGNYLLTDQRMNHYDEEEPLERWVSSTRGHNVVEINDAVGKGGKVYAVQYDPYVFEYEQNEAGEYVPKKDENGVEMIDDPLWVEISSSSFSSRSGSIFPEDREINDVYDYVRGKSYTYKDVAAPSLYNEDFDVQRNVLFLRSGYFVVTDYAKPELGLAYSYQDDYMKENNIEGHKYKQIWHFTDEANISFDYEKNTVKTNFNGAANIVVATVKSNDNMRLQYKYGLYPKRRGVFAVTKYATFEQYEKGAMTFNTILYPTRVGENVDITTRKIELDLPEDSANAFQATITDTDRNLDTDVHFYTLLDRNLQAPTTFGAYETDGTLALGEKKAGNYVNAVLRHGSYLENSLDNEYAIYSKDELTDIGVYWQNDEIDIAYNDEDSYNIVPDLTRLTVKANNKVSKVRFNGEEVEFKQNGKYIYFGDEPILYGGDEIPGTNNNESENGSSDGGHANIGGGGGGGAGGGGGGGSSSDNKKDEEKPQTPPSDTETELAPMPSDEYSKELDGHWAQEEISTLVNNAVVNGYGDGTLGLDRNITRAQFITMLVRALGVPVEKYAGSFDDVSAGLWHADYIETALKNGWIQGDGKNVNPDRNITREEITKILVSAYEQKYGEITALPESQFTDSAAISSWASEFVEKAVGAGLVNGMGDGTFSPKTNAKREQAMVLIYRLINSEQTKTEKQE